MNTFSDCTNPASIMAMSAVLSAIRLIGQIKPYRRATSPWSVPLHLTSGSIRHLPIAHNFPSRWRWYRSVIRPFVPPTSHSWQFSYRVERGVHFRHRFKMVESIAGSRAPRQNESHFTVLQIGCHWYRAAWWNGWYSFRLINARRASDFFLRGYKTALIAQISCLQVD